MGWFNHQLDKVFHFFLLGEIRRTSGSCSEPVFCWAFFRPTTPPNWEVVSELLVFEGESEGRFWWHLGTSKDVQ